MRFADIPGLNEVKQVLVQSVQRQHVAHAQLFRGAEGSGALALALAYGAFLNCENRQPQDSCGQCASCRKIDRLVHPDLNFILPVTTTKAVSKDALSHKFAAEWRTFVLAESGAYQGLNDWMQHIGAENKQGNISKDEAVQLLKLVSLKAFEAQFKLVVVWLPELMHPAAANAVLKLLEEPPPATVFLLVCQQPDKLLPTILSRVQLVPVRQFREEEITQHLVGQFGVLEVKARQLAQLTEGNLGAALAARDQDGGNDYFQTYADWMRACYGLSLEKIVAAADNFQKMGRENQKEFLQYALGLTRKVLLYGLDPQLVPHLPAQEQTFISRFCQFVHRLNADDLVRELNDAHFHIERNANPRITFVDTSLQLAEYLRLPAAV
ncbi:DNA polymerase III subunit delta [Hymenobacter busanensis]|uniref:DNA polymerase III subunit delta n=1 Tax=Hymenobacter busanensis TaxID=2607656 RepID=A0A7L5A0J6_9BACT|nr:DNA polymerase III subunit delta [Hymenobacter busanensis]KAA9338524.1 DNA polymerase III subunit delta [Hymenobacter busanensis]QHJ09048.1 DNA polymerase III subunit delta [Hymenobacter busanensis]